MDIQSLKIDIIHWLTELTDKNVLEKIEAIKKETELELTSVQQLELEKRLNKYELGETELKSWEETKINVRIRYKDAL
jgi:hypothetical protein